MKKERKFKILLAGEPQSGKSSIADKTDACFPFKPYGVSIGKTTRLVQPYDLKVTLILWTMTTGRPKDTTYFHGARAAIVVGNLTKRETVLNMRSWAEAIFEYLDKIPIIFVGNMTDQASLVNIETMKRIVKDFDGEYFLTTEKDKLTFEKIFNTIARILLQRKIPDSPKEPFGYKGFYF